MSVSSPVLPRPTAEERHPPRKRLRAADRRQAIIDGAAFVFAEHGYSAATTQAIAQRTGVSEALLYRHFRSKAALYRAVLQRLMRQQDTEILASQYAAASEYEYVVHMRDFLARRLDMRDGSDAAISTRLLMASLAGDGIYARLIFRRALRKRRGTWTTGHQASGGTPGIGARDLLPANAMLLINHVGLMLAATVLPGQRIAPYDGTRDQLLRDALLFCARGLGVSTELVEAVLAEGASG